jgi:phosphate-selective porin OprO and OprP
MPPPLGVTTLGALTLAAHGAVAPLGDDAKEAPQEVSASPEDETESALEAGSDPPEELTPDVSSAAFTLTDGYRVAPPEGDTVRVQFGEGFTAQSRDGAFLVNIRARMQLRATGTGPSPEGDNSTMGFMVRRARLVLQGHLFDKRWEYYFQLGFANLDMEPDLRIPLRDAVLSWTRLRDFRLRIGQMKTPFDRQRVISSSALMFTDRSIVTQELNLDRDVGIQAYSRDLFGLKERLAYQLGIYGGDGRNRISSDANFLVVGRVQVSPFGGSQAEFDDYAESVAERPRSPRLAVAGGVAYNYQTNRAQSTLGETYALSRFNYLHAETDFIFKWRGLSWQGQWLFRRAHRGSFDYVVDMEPLTETSRSGWGWFTQTGYRFVTPVEIAARYGELHPLRDVTEIVLQRELGPALSYYLSDHALKLQADYFYLFADDIQRGRHEARLQMQLFF